jgi:hypothetical protein
MRNLFGESKTDLQLRVQIGRSAGHLAIHCATVEGFSGNRGGKVREKRGEGWAPIAVHFA